MFFFVLWGFPAVISPPSITDFNVSSFSCSLMQQHIQISNRFSSSILTVVNTLYFVTFPLWTHNILRISMLCGLRTQLNEIAVNERNPRSANLGDCDLILDSWTITWFHLLQKLLLRFLRPRTTWMSTDRFSRHSTSNNMMLTCKKCLYHFILKQLHGTFILCWFWRPMWTKEVEFPRMMTALSITTRVVKILIWIASAFVLEVKDRKKKLLTI